MPLDGGDLTAYRDQPGTLPAVRDPLPESVLGQSTRAPLSVSRSGVGQAWMEIDRLPQIEEGPGDRCDRPGV
jgi:hypothetical protein